MKPMSSPDAVKTEDLRRWFTPVRDLLIVRLKDHRGVHLQTAISGIAALAGCLLLRSTGVPLTRLKPGEPVFVDAVNELGASHTEFLMEACAAMGVEPLGGWNDRVPSHSKPLMSVVELTHLLEKPFADLCDLMGVPLEARVRLALFTAVGLIRDGKGILLPGVGKALVLSAVVTGSKTVPHPLPGADLAHGSAPTRGPGPG